MMLIKLKVYYKGFIFFILYLKYIIIFIVLKKCGVLKPQKKRGLIPKSHKSRKIIKYLKK